MLRAVVTALVYASLLIISIPLLLVAKLLVMAPRIPVTVRNVARLILVFAAFLALYELGAVLGTAPRTVMARPQFEALLVRLSGRFFGRGLAFAGMQLKCDRPAPPVTGRPVVVLARHAGVFNSELALYLIARDLRHSPHTIAKQIAAVCPGLHRVYAGNGVAFFKWNETGRTQAMRHLQHIATQAQARDAFLLFPEGANYTRGRRSQALADLCAQGKQHVAERMTGMRHMLPPQTGGARLLVTGVPSADVLIFAQTGLEDLLSCSGQIGYRSDGRGIVHTAWWHIPADEVPRHAVAFEQWLVDRWQAADDWIASVRGTAVTDRQRKVSHD